MTAHFAKRAEGQVEASLLGVKCRILLVVLESFTGDWKLVLCHSRRFIFLIRVLLVVYVVTKIVR